MFNNQLQIIGNVVKDAEVKTSKNGKRYLSFTVAVYEGKDKPSLFIDVLDSIRDDAQEHPLQQYITKGSKVFCQGRMQPGGYYSDKKKEYIPTTTLWLTACEPIKTSDNSQGGGAAPKEEKVAQIFPEKTPQPSSTTYEETKESTELPF